jgi:hypothetical protein
MKRWTAVARYVLPDGKKIERTLDFDEFAGTELADWMEQGPDWTTLISLRIDYRLNY